MKRLLLILLLPFLLNAQVISHKATVDMASNSYEELIASPFFDSGDLPENSVWTGTIILNLQIQSNKYQRQRMYDQWTINQYYGSCPGYHVTGGGAQEFLYYWFAQAGISTCFTFPTGSTLDVQYHWTQIWTGSIDTTWDHHWVWNATDGYFWCSHDHYTQNTGTGSNSMAFQDKSYRYTRTTTPSTRDNFCMRNVIGAGTNGIPASIDTLAQLRINFILWIGASAGNIHLCWAAPRENDLRTAPWYWYATTLGTPTYSTTVRRGSTLWMKRIS